ncbi:arylsulfatase B-like [Haemaphysalis longicornis]
MLHREPKLSVRSLDSEYSRAQNKMTSTPLLILLLSVRVCHSLHDKLPPNIIFILADEVGWDDVSFHGSTQIPTPNLDALAADGIILHNFYVQHECTPSRSALLTGLYPIHTGTQHFVIMPAEPRGLSLENKLLSEYLKDLGYETHLVGKWHLGVVSKEYTPTYRGFDTFYGFLGGGEDYYNHTNRFNGHVGLDFWYNTEPLWNETGHYSTTLFTERAKTVIKDRNKNKPLFLYLSHQATHSGSDVQFAAPIKNIEKFSYIGEEARVLYAAIMDTLDESVGEVMEALHEEGMLDNTIVVFTSDNGGSPFGPYATRSYNWPLRGAKFALWEGSTRVPAFVWSPLLAKRRRVSKQLMHITDWLPTLYSAAGGNTDKLGSHLDGIDMWRHLSFGLPSPRTEMLYNIDSIDKTAALRRGNHKLVLGTYGDGEFDGRFKTTGNPRPWNDLDELTANSTVAHVLRRFYGVNDLQFPSDWRQRASVQCGEEKNADSNFVSGQSPYLFDLTKDPCELHNLASSHPKLVSILEKTMASYAATAVPPENLPVDENGYPENLNGLWGPWM